ncbi:YfiR family protein [Lampropedia puyangensis]|uniref:YfiR family protein n=1 Tax=Lampropedia puyangensis TaxID=1330072 RepID=A0A4S8F4J5_9BURK|nr:YfiR family protein [Lampropedia puyangensis]THU02007.1 YfiR family protein [Lampropedia puyangensis]
MRNRLLTFFASCFASMAICGISSSAFAQAQHPEKTHKGVAAQRPKTQIAPNILGLRRILQGVIEYSQWPTPLHTINLCVADHPLLLASLHQHPIHSHHSTVAVKSVRHTDDTLAITCSVLFIGQSTPEAVAIAWVTSLVEQPVFTIRENPPECSSGVMICLRTANTKQPTFEVNLDAVARSGIQLSPLILRLTNRKYLESVNL